MELIDIFYEYNLFETLEEILKSQSSGKSATAKIQPNLPKSLKTQKKKPKNTMDIELYQKNANYYISEIIIISLQFAPTYFRNFVLSQNQKFLKYPFLSLICDNILNNEEMTQRVLVWINT